MKITKTFIACDDGGEKCPNDQLHTIRISIDGVRKTIVVCDGHVEPWKRLFAKAGSAKPSRARVYSSPSEAKRKS